MFAIKPINQDFAEQIQSKIEQKTKPLGALGLLETLAKQIALIKSSREQDKVFSVDDKLAIKQPTLLIFAADHGIAEEGVSIASSAVTQQMVLNFLNGGAAINCFCRTNNMALRVIDAGILMPLEHPNLIQQSLGQSTQNFSQQAAMSLAQVEQGIALGAQVAQQQIANGSNLLAFGEMGIGNTSSAAAIMAAVLNLKAEQCVGAGTGIDQTALKKKTRLIQQALELHQEKLHQEKPYQEKSNQERLNHLLNILACVGGYEVVQLVGAMLGAAEKQCMILIDGFIVTAAALVAVKINPNVRDYMVFCHQSNEQGHQLMLQALKAKPLLSLGLRLGEGTGAALALPLIDAAVSFYNDMASFEAAGVEVEV
jgi:nicotinate-nucleotide--dimethylbenzimidazole phosphoribosyltransferase